jgi:transposase
MANKPLNMSKVRKVIQLHHRGKSNKFISKYLAISRNSVIKYLSLYKVLGIEFEELMQRSDAELESLFITSVPVSPSDRLKKLQAFFPYMERQLKKTGVTKMLMWKEYIASHPDGYRSSQFCEHYNRWTKKVSPLMHMTHKMGDKMYVDYAGKTLEVVSQETGEVQEVQFFVAILGASQYTYAEASPSQKKEDFVASVENAMRYFEGVPAAIVPDNLKSAVIKSDRFEPTINETLMDLAEHYQTTILPARAYKPRDKSLAEGAVKILYQRLYPLLRQEVFYSIEDLNQRIWELLEEHNRTKLTGRPFSRYQLFVEDERSKLSALPVERFEIRHQSFATVNRNSHVMLGADKHYYSVPYQYIRKKVKLVYTKSGVMIYHKYNRIAIHKRDKRAYYYSTIQQHLPATHQFLIEWSPQVFIEKAAELDASVEQLVVHILEGNQHPEQAYKSCMGILSLEKKVGKDRLINACQRALEHGIYNYKIVKNILEKGLDQIEKEKPPITNQLPIHNNIRGNNYYA